MKLSQMFDMAKRVNTYNKKLSVLLQHPLNQIKLVQIIDTKALFVAENSSILTLAKQQHETLTDTLNDNFHLNIDEIEIKLKY